MTTTSNTQKPDLKKSAWPEDYSDYYDAPAYCTNCGKMNNWVVRMGVRRKGLHAPCDRCGCEVEL